jgi:competence CoiA-like predicted nuclease
MGFKAKYLESEIISIKFNTVEWQKLKKNSSFKEKLKMPCCDARTIMKNSHLGLQYFAHHKKDDCHYSSESMEHLLAKKIAYDAAIKAGWNASVECISYLNENLKIISDIVLEKNGYKIALEFQFSNQAVSTMKERTDKYKQLGIPVVWFNGFSNKTYEDIGNKSNLDFQIYKIEKSWINKEMHLLCDGVSLEEFLIDKLIQTEKSQNNLSIEKYLVFEDDFIRLPKEISEDNIKIYFEHTWIGFMNGFYRANQDEPNNILLKGKYLRGFKMDNFEVTI